MSSYQSLTNRPDIVSYVRNQRVTGSIYVFNLQVSYNGGHYMDMIEKSSNNLPVGNKSQVGLNAIYIPESGML